MTALRRMPVLPSPALPRDIVAARSVQADPRWPAIVDALAALREKHRHAVRIVDADCGCGTFLIAVARHAHGLGFTAIEGRGIDGSPALIGRARAAAMRLRDRAIGLRFDLADMHTALADEAEFPADIIVWHGANADDAVMAALTAAADRVIADRTSRERAA